MPGSVLVYRVIRRLYRDSVALMSVSSDLEKTDGVLKAGVVMATPANHDILARSGMLPPDLVAEPDDLLIVVRAHLESIGNDALDQAVAALSASPSAPRSSSSLEFVPRTVAEALDVFPAELVTVSVPGEFAGAVCHQALTAGCHVFCFSDNVRIDDEDRLKQLAADNGLLHMGPDCGTALIDGTPLGFANDIPDGRIAMIAASGTGAQEVSTILARAGIGMKHIIGVGGRDLSGRIHSPAAFVALENLEHDEDVELIVVVSKPPAAEMTKTLLERLSRLQTPTVACLLGEQDTAGTPTICGTLEGAAIEVAARLGVNIDTAGPAVPDTVSGDAILGLYTGGTLAHEARIISKGSNVRAHILDLGDDTYTQGRPHPMISPELRVQLIDEMLAPGDYEILLLDVVLGWGSAPDPASPVADAVRAARERARAAGRELLVFTSVTGTHTDHQGYDQQREVLTAADILVYPTNAAAVRAALAAARKER